MSSRRLCTCPATLISLGGITHTLPTDHDSHSRCGAESRPGRLSARGHVAVNAGAGPSQLLNRRQGCGRLSAADSSFQLTTEQVPLCADVLAYLFVRNQCNLLARVSSARGSTASHRYAGKGFTKGGYMEEVGRCQGHPPHRLRADDAGVIIAPPQPCADEARPTDVLATAQLAAAFELLPAVASFVVPWDSTSDQHHQLTNATQAYDLRHERLRHERLRHERIAASYMSP